MIPSAPCPISFKVIKSVNLKSEPGSSSIKKELKLLLHDIILLFKGLFIILFTDEFILLLVKLLFGLSTIKLEVL